jgi:hypothetical protein
MDAAAARSNSSVIGVSGLQANLGEGQRDQHTFLNGTNTRLLSVGGDGSIVGGSILRSTAVQSQFENSCF